MFRTYLSPKLFVYLKFKFYWASRITSRIHSRGCQQKCLQGSGGPLDTVRRCVSMQEGCRRDAGACPAHADLV